MSLLGKDLSFYKLLEAQADAAYRAAEEFHALSRDFGKMATISTRIEAIEHEGDELTHELANKTAATFVTPLDKEDLQALSSGLDDITDLIEAATGRIVIYKLEEARPDLEPLVNLLVQITDATREAIGQLRHSRHRESMRPLNIGQSSRFAERCSMRRARFTKRSASPKYYARHRLFLTS